jgi:VWFA-related protein
MRLLSSAILAVIIGCAAISGVEARTRRIASTCSIAIERPLDGQILYGAVEIMVRTGCPDDTAVDRVVFMVDGEVVSEKSRKPYRMVWEAGGAFRSHLVEVRLIDGLQRVAVDVLATPGSVLGESLRVTSTPIDLVELSVSVIDREGRHVPDLAIDDFIVKEGGKTQTLDTVQPEHRPLSLAVVIDVSSSLERYWPLLMKATPALARTLGPEDAAKVIAFSGPAYLVQDFTHDAVSIAESMRGFHSWGGPTSLYDTLAAVGTELAWTRAGRQAIVLLTDGVDTLSGIDAKRLRDYLRRTDVSVDAFLVQSETSVVNRNAAGFHKALKKLCRETGGSLNRLDLKDIDRMEDEFRRIGRELQNRYYIAYHSDQTIREGKWRTIKVRTRDAGFEVKTRRGVIANRDITHYLLGDLRRGDISERTKAAEWLGNMRAAGAAGPLLEALGDRSPEVRGAAALALGRIRDPRAIEPLVRLLSSRYEVVGHSAAEGLYTFGPAAVPALIESLGHPRARGRAGGGGEDGRIKTLDVLAAIGDVRAIAAITDLAKPPRPPATTADGSPPARSNKSQRRSDTRIRLWAIWSLGQMERVETVPILEKGLEDHNPEVRLASVWALGEIGTQQVIHILQYAARRETALEVQDAFTTVLRRLAPAAPDGVDPE